MAEGNRWRCASGYSVVIRNSYGSVLKDLKLRVPVTNAASQGSKARYQRDFILALFLI